MMHVDLNKPVIYAVRMTRSKSGSRTTTRMVSIAVRVVGSDTQILRVVLNDYNNPNSVIYLSGSCRGSACPSLA